MLSDEIVDEVRGVREAHASKFNYDLRAIFEDLKKSEAIRLANGHPLASFSPPMPNPSFQRIRFAHR
jgi:hypothetical protein